LNTIKKVTNLPRTSCIAWMILHLMNQCCLVIRILKSSPPLLSSPCFRAYVARSPASTPPRAREERVRATEAAWVQLCLPSSLEGGPGRTSHRMLGPLSAACASRYDGASARVAGWGRNVHSVKMQPNNSFNPRIPVPPRSPPALAAALSCPTSLPPPGPRPLDLERRRRRSSHSKPRLR
jgi:hypothetical protein